MAQSATDLDLLFGLLALQNGLIDQGALVAAFQAWTRDKGRSVAEHLIYRGDLDADDAKAVEAPVARHLRRHGGEAEKSLASVSTGRLGLRVPGGGGRPRPRGDSWACRGGFSTDGWRW